MQDDNSPLYIYGRHPVEEMLAADPKKIQKIFIKSGLETKFFSYLKEQSSQHRIPMTETDDRKLSQLAEGGNHQGVAALAAPVAFVELKDWITTLDMAMNPACVVLDELEDPHNVGAIIRTAAGLGAAGVIFGKHNQAQLTGAVYKTSAGTLGKIPLIRVSNINDSLLKLKDAGFWIAGLAAEGSEKLSDGKFDSPTCFVIGAEGKGVRQKTLEHCDFVFSVPMANGVESLNASVTAALALYEWARARK